MAHFLNAAPSYVMVHIADTWSVHIYVQDTILWLFCIKNVFKLVPDKQKGCFTYTVYVNGKGLELKMCPFTVNYLFAWHGLDET